MGPARPHDCEGAAGHVRGSTMKLLNIFRARLRALVRREAVIEEIDREMRLHLEMETEANIERGMSPQDARRAALASFGNLGRTRDLAYEVRGGGMIEALWQDLRYGARMFLKQPGFTLIAVLTLALGIGANTAIFSVVNAVLLRPLPFAEPESLVWLWDTLPQLPTAPTSLPEFLDWKAQNQSFEHLAAFQGGKTFLDTGDGTEEARVGLVTPETFALFRVSPILGRTFTDEETLPGRFRVAVLGQAMWQSRFGSDPNALGRTIDLNGAPYTIIGVMPEGFSFPDQAELWRPLVIDPKNLDRGPHYLRVVGRLKPAVTLEQAQAEMSALAAQLSKQHPEKNSGHGIKLVPLRDIVVGDIGPALFILLGAVGFVLLIACANVANLLLSRVGVRQKEIAVRTALGASRLRIVRQLFTESMMLSVGGGVAGLLIAVWGVNWLVAMAPDTIPRVHEIAVDPRVISFTLLISVATSLLFGLAPALQASRPDLAGALKEGGRSSAGVSRNWLRNVLMIIEVALSLVLLIGAGLMIRSFAKLSQVDPGFNPDRVLTIGVSLLRNKYPEEERVASFYSQLLERAAATPGVVSAGAISDLPLLGSNTNDNFTIEGRPPVAKQEEPITEYHVATPRFFEAMGIPLLAGRDFAETDTKQAPNVVVINEAFANRHFAGESPLGHRISLQGQERDPLLIVGVVGDVRQLGLDQQPVPEAYVPFLQDPLSKSYQRSLTIVARTESDPAAAAGSLRAELTSLDKSLPVYDLKPMTEYMRDSLARRRFNLILLTAFSVVALVLAAVGIYGVISYGVTQRTHEIGIRMALGAEKGDVLRLVVGQGMIMALGGVAIGLVASFVLTRLMETLLFGVSVTDPLTFTVIALLLMCVALLACFVPARRATKVDPLVALRYE
ncbi:MAG TPA: ABC transporter permease [Blastocatellia bacterium]|nr:ABC transporter permease [Blastocatellia bacterium]